MYDEQPFACRATLSVHTSKVHTARTRSWLRPPPPRSAPPAEDHRQAAHRRRSLDQRPQGCDDAWRQPHEGRREDTVKDTKSVRADAGTTRDAAVSTGRSAVLLAGNYAERVAYVQVGAVLTARDTATATIDDLRVRDRRPRRRRDGAAQAREARRGRPHPHAARGQEGPHARRARAASAPQPRHAVTSSATAPASSARSARCARTPRRRSRTSARPVRDIQIPALPQVPDVVTPVREVVRPVVDRFAA